MQIHFWVGFLSLTLALTPASAHLCHAQLLSRPGALTPLAQFTALLLSPVTDAFVTVSVFVSALFLPLCFAIIGHGLKGDMLSRSALWHKFNNPHTHIRTKVRCCLKLSRPLNRAHEERWQVYDRCRTLKAGNKSSLSQHQMGFETPPAEGLLSKPFKAPPQLLFFHYLLPSTIYP